jgi:3-oxoacyl-[acyl-carrier-protein] synthase II
LETRVGRNEVTKDAAGRERVVITGMGTINALAHNTKETWESLVVGRSGVGPVTRFDASQYPCRIAAEIKDFEAQDYIPLKAARRMARCSQLLVAAAQEALVHANLTPPLDDEQGRVGLVVGTAVGGMEEVEKNTRLVMSRGIRSVRPTALPSCLPNMPAYHLADAIHAQGYTCTIVTACAAGTQSLCHALEVLRQGRADMIVAGGTEAPISPVAYAGWVSMRILSTCNDAPWETPRPFSSDRDGLVVGEGCAVIVLERLAHALGRGAPILVEVLGQAASVDPYNVATPDPTGSGAARAIRWALEDAMVEPAQVDYINAHAAGTILGDAMETAAIKRLFGRHAYRIPVSATKSMLGHSFGASGAIEALACIKSIQTGIIHPTINYHSPDPVCDLDYVPNMAREADVRITLSNSFGLGGQNACLVLGRYEP